jgi:hypothetical protein
MYFWAMPPRFFVTGATMVGAKRSVKKITPTE